MILRIINVFYYFTLSTGESFDSFCKTFSLIEPNKALLKFDRDNKLIALYGFKILTMIIVLFGHRLFNLSGNPMNNPEFIEFLSHENICEINY